MRFTRVSAVLVLAAFVGVTLSGLAAAQTTPPTTTVVKKPPLTPDALTRFGAAATNLVLKNDNTFPVTNIELQHWYFVDTNGDNLVTEEDDIWYQTVWTSSQIAAKSQKNLLVSPGQYKVKYEYLSGGRTQTRTIETFGVVTGQTKTVLLVK